MSLSVLTSIVAILTLVSVIGCASSKHDEGSEHEAQGELSGHLPSHEEGGGEGEESGQQFAKNEAYDQVRNGARLKLVYDAEANAFVGTVENTTERRLARVRVEVHLSSGVELGPTTPTNLAPGQKIEVELKATGHDFAKWSAHPEIGSGEHGEGGEHGGEGEHDGEHSEEGEHR